MCGVGDRTNVANSDLSDVLPEEVEVEVKLAVEISMGTEVSEEDINNIMHLCDQVWIMFVSLMAGFCGGYFALIALYM